MTFRQGCETKYTRKKKVKKTLTTIETPRKTWFKIKMAKHAACQNCCTTDFFMITLNFWRWKTDLFHIKLIVCRSIKKSFQACVSQKTQKPLGPKNFSGFFSDEFLRSRKAFLKAPKNIPDSPQVFLGSFVRFIARAWWWLV